MSLARRLPPLVNEVAGRFGLKVVRTRDRVVRPFAVLDLVVDRLVADGRPPYCLQVGAHDGVRNDPLRPSLLRHGLPAILVEPMPDFHEKLAAGHADRPNVKAVHAAVDRVSGERPFYRVRPGTEGPAWVQGIASFDRAHLTDPKLGLTDIDRQIEELTVRTVSIPNLLAEHGSPEIGLLQVDTEGFDGEVVTMALDAGLTPDVINYEFVHLPTPERDRLQRRLADAGYRFVDVRTDTLCVHERTGI